ncbi:MAG: GNAT family N-acetyltransferase [Deltaproteobacteria bacterium]|nr:MAG: GNAT family N-acetyltransferase [Deltaproteobacteria bacterium]
MARRTSRPPCRSPSPMRDTCPTEARRAASSKRDGPPDRRGTASRRPERRCGPGRPRRADRRRKCAAGREAASRPRRRLLPPGRCSGARGRGWARCARHRPGPGPSRRNRCPSPGARSRRPPGRARLRARTPRRQWRASAASPPRPTRPRWRPPRTAGSRAADRSAAGRSRGPRARRVRVRTPGGGACCSCNARNTAPLPCSSSERVGALVPLAARVGRARTPAQIGGYSEAMIRLLRHGDEAELERFLAPLADSSLFLLANSRKGGLSDEGQPFQATYAGAFEDGGMVGVAACSWLGTVVVQAPRELAGVVREAIRASGRVVTAMIGPYQQAVAACAAIGRSPLSLERDLLFGVDLAALEGPEILSRARVAQELLFADGALFVLEREGTVVSMAGFNARTAETAQVGGVYTPPELRGRGHARCAVAGALLAARASGASRGILFTAESNGPAQRSYQAIGFRPIGDYGLLRI